MSRATPIPTGEFCSLKSGHRIHYVEAGQPNADRPTILCLHGGGPGASGYSNYKKNMPALAEAGYHVIAPDLLGFGLSDKPTDIDYSSQLHVACMRELCSSIGVQQCVPMGNSLGGSVALELYFSDRELVSALILMAPGGLHDPATFWGSTDGGMALARYAQERPEGEEAFREVLSLLVHDAAILDDITVAERYPIAINQPSRVFTTVSIQPTWEWLADIKCPVLCFWGSNDRFLPATQVMTLLEKTPQTKAVISNQAGHWYMLELPDDFNSEVLNFLNAEPTPPTKGHVSQ